MKYILALTLIGSAAFASTNFKGDRKPASGNERVVIGTLTQTDSGDVLRIIDPDNGNTCYIVKYANVASISCLPKAK